MNVTSNEQGTIIEYTHENQRFKLYVNNEILLEQNQMSIFTFLTLLQCNMFEPVIYHKPGQEFIVIPLYYDQDYSPIMMLNMYILPKFKRSCVIGSGLNFDLCRKIDDLSKQLKESNEHFKCALDEINKLNQRVDELEVTNRDSSVIINTDDVDEI